MTELGPRIRIGVDTGGTFTDVVAVDTRTNRIVTTKTPSTPSDPADGFLNGVRKILAMIGADAGTSAGDVAAILHAARETGVIVTAEEHQIGALAWRVSGVITESPLLYGIPVITGAIGVKDRFGDSGAPWELIKEFEVSAEHIAQKAAELIAIAKVKKEEEKLALVH